VPVLTAVDLLAIQGFVFSSNRLRDVVGASELVTQAASDAVLVGELGAPDVLVAAGGNAVLRFPGSEEARAFAGRYTRWLLERAPGLEAAVAHRPFREGELAAALLALQVDLARARAERRPSVPLLGLGVTAACRDTGQPAVYLDGPGPRLPRSRLVREARRAVLASGARWQRLLDALVPAVPLQLGFPSELDHLRRPPAGSSSSDDRSLIGVVHVDGNGVGGRIAAWLTERADAGEADATVAAQYREWSTALTELVEAALAKVAARVVAALVSRPDGRGGQEVVIAGTVPSLDFTVARDGATVLLPLRPILLGGDDLTFVCDGRVALDLAATAVEAFEGAEMPHLGRLSACAGVGIVRSHSPFIRAYALAEDLCASAKREVRDRGWDGGMLDWHLGATRPGEGIQTIRDRQHRGRGPQVTDLTCRPYRVGGGPDEVGSWRWLIDDLLGDRPASLRGPAWRQRRGKLDALTRVARDGPMAVARQLDAWRVSFPDLSLPEAIADGFLDGRTPLLDAVELLDRAQTLDATVSQPSPQEHTA
jgi:hypothetical protein